MSIEQMVYGRVQVVRLPELSDPSPFPFAPRFLRGAREWLAVVFENGDGMTLPGQHHRR